MWTVCVSITAGRRSKEREGEREGDVSRNRTKVVMEREREREREREILMETRQNSGFSACMHLYTYQRLCALLNGILLLLLLLLLLLSLSLSLSLSLWSWSSFSLCMGPPDVINSSSSAGPQVSLSPSSVRRVLQATITTQMGFWKRPTLLLAAETNRRQQRQTQETLYSPLSLSLSMAIFWPNLIRSCKFPLSPLSPLSLSPLSPEILRGEHRYCV